MPRATVDDLARAHRVLCHGVTGSGKSTAAQRLGRALGLPVHLVDEEIGWLPGWVPRDKGEQREIAARIASREQWVVDSTYSGFRDVVLPRAEVVVALDYPRWLSLGRLVRRTASRVARGTRTCNGNTETLRRVLSTDSIIRWHFSSFASKRQRARSWEVAPEGPKVLRLGHPRDLDAVVTILEARQCADGRRREPA